MQQCSTHGIEVQDMIAEACRLRLETWRLPTDSYEMRETGPVVDVVAVIHRRFHPSLQNARHLHPVPIHLHLHLVSVEHLRRFCETDADDGRNVDAFETGRQLPELPLCFADSGSVAETRTRL